MNTKRRYALTRRQFLKLAGGTAAAMAMPAVLSACGATGGGGPIRIGLLLPYSDIYAVLGESITEAMQLYFEQNGNELAGRPVEVITEDTEINPDVAQQKARKLVEQDEVDLVAGIVSSGVLAGLRDYFDETQTLLLVANAGANSLSRGAKTPYIWRTSFTNWMAPYTMGQYAPALGQRAIISVPDYAAGEDNINAFTNAFEANGGQVVAVQRTPFPNMGDPAPFMAELANAEADMVYSFYSGGAAVTFVKAYDEFGIKEQKPLLAAGFMVEEDVLPAQGSAAEGVQSALHWSYVLDNAANNQFKEDFRAASGRDADVFAVQGYDTARVIDEMLRRTDGSTDVDLMVEALDGISFDSPRGPFRLDANSQAPEQNMYLRVVQDVDGTLRNVVEDTLGLIVDPGDDSQG